MVRVARQYHLLDENHRRYMRLAKKAFALAEKVLWNSPLQPEDVLRLSEEVERLWFRIDALS